MLDVDGTLTPIRKFPEWAKLSRNTAILLEKLSNIPSITTVFISGRTVDSLRKLIGLNNVIHTGEHGLEIKGRGFSHDYRSQIVSRLLPKLRKRLAGTAGKIPGVYLETKKHSFCIHYRSVRLTAIKKVMAASVEALHAYESKGMIRIMHGKKVIEVRPNIYCNKGTAVRFLLKHFKKTHKNIFPVFAGDDISDEDAFKELKGKGITIHVGAGRKSLAKHRVRNIAEMINILRKLYSIRGELSPADCTDDRRQRR